MTHDATVTADKEVDKNTTHAAMSQAPELSTLPHAQTKLTAGDANVGASKLSALEPTKREMTRGEIEFNLKAYVGWGLIGNEVFSLAITESVGKGQHGNPRFAHGLYKKFEGLFEGLGKHFERFKTPGLMRSIGDYTSGMKALNHVPRLPYLLVATIGGMLVVPFVKDREDRKGEIVRKLDRKHYGARADTDPALIEAHKEMDEAPKQSWGSLWKGRITTVIFAALADFTFGWPEALTTKAFKNNPTYQKFASLERISNAFADWSSTAMKVKPSNEWLFKKVVGNGTWLLTLSSSLTAIFYVSSKLFAKKRDERMERRTHGHEGALRDDDIDTLEPEVLTQKGAAVKPETKVSSVAHEAMLSAREPQLAASH
jgi:hypothetical protein